MQVELRPADRSVVTAESMATYLANLAGQGFIDNESGIRHVSYEHWDADDLGTRVGERFAKPTVTEAIDLIRNNGVEWLSVGLAADGHYEYDGRPEDLSKLTTIMYCLNHAATAVAEAVGEEVQTDFYYSPDFQSGSFPQDWGVAEICQMTLPGEGGYIPDDRMDECMEILRAEMKKQGPELEELIALLEQSFGTISLRFNYNDLG